MRAVLLVLVAGAALTAWLGVRSTGLVPGLQVGGFAYWAFLAALGLPPAWMAWRLLARAGAASFAWLAALSLTGAAGLLPIAGLMTLFSGFATELKQLYWLFWLWGYIGLVFLIGVLAAIAYRGARTPGVPAGWASAIGLSIVYVVAAHAGVAATIRYEQATVHDRIGAARQARQALERIDACAAQALQRPGALGVPATLAGLGPAGSGCLDAVLASGKLPAYAIHWLAAPAIDGRIPGYVACALPTDYPRGAGQTFAGDGSGERVQENGDPKRPDPLPCEAVWHGDPGPVSALRGLRHCAFLYAKSRPTEGYPPSLAELRNFGCLPSEFVKAYETDAQAPRLRFSARAEGGWHGRYGSFLIDESGTLRYAEKGPATRESTPLHEVEKAGQAAMQSQKDARLKAGAEDLAACEKGDAEACERYAEHAAFDLNLPEESKKNFERACAAGRRAACLSVRSTDMKRNESHHAVMWFRNLCRKGNPRACEAIGKVPEEASRDEVRVLEEWVRGHGG